MADTSAMMDWIDPKHHSAKLYVTKLPSEQVALVITGLTVDMPEWERAQGMGYQVSRTGRFLFQSIDRTGVLSLSKIRQIFPRAVPVQLPKNRVFMRNRTDTSSAHAATSLRDVAPIGLNALGQPVFEGKGGRYLFVNGKPRVESATSVAGHYLRAPNAEQLATCADGFVERMARGEVLRANDLRRHAAIVFGDPGFMRLDDPRLRVVQESVEAAIQRRQHTIPGVDEDAYLMAVKLNENQPPLNYRSSTSVTNQQYSTPIPMAILAQMLAGDVENKLVREPTIGNGSLVMSLPSSTRVSGVEIDPDRVAQVKRLRDNSEIVTGNVLNTKFSEAADVILSNPPFGGLDRPVQVGPLKVHRLDYQIMLHALASRKDEGRAVFIVAADNENKISTRAGQVHGSSRTMFKWLSDHYEIADITEFDGRLYAKQGAQFPTRMITLGRRRSSEEAKQRYAQPVVEVGDTQYRLTSDGLAGELPVVHTWEEAWNRMIGVAHRLDVSEVEWSNSKKHKSEHIEIPAVGATLRKNRTQEDVDQSKPEINEYQAPYIAQCSVGQASSMVPRNLEAPIAKALEKFKNVHGMRTDEYVRGKLDLNDEELSAFSPEQVDAIALAIDKIESGRGFILGDQTGIGKGRILAGVARYAALRGMPIVFVTKKPNLFTDFWRDLQDVNSDHMMRPIIMNEGVAILDQNNQPVVPPTRRAEFDRVVDSQDGLLESGYNLLMMTYSQVNRANNRKSLFMRRVAAEGSLLVLDESHDAAGESNVGLNCAAAVNEAKAVMYSSATYCKDAKNMRVYAKAFPASVKIDSLADVLATGGEPLQEVLSAQLAEDGAFVRREHDLSELEFTTIEDTANRDRNRVLSDKVSEILRGMAYMSGDVSKQMISRLEKDARTKLEALGDAQRKGSRMGVNYVNFGSRLYNLLRQFALALKTDFVAEASVRALREGRKPVIALEQTNESVLTEVLLGEGLDLEVDEVHDDLVQQMEMDKAALKGDSPENLMNAVKEIGPVDFRHILRRVLARLSVIKTSDFYGNVTVASAKSLIPPGMNQDEAEELHDAYRANEAQIAALIDELPAMPISPIDAIAQRLEEAGLNGDGADAGAFTVAEVSGRKYSIRTNEEGNILIGKRIDRRLEDIYRFNSGEAEALFLTRAGSTGLSVHASERFADQRQRELFELQIANDVNERVQFFGRVNRKGQVCSPRITAVSTGLPFEMRILAMQNGKLRKLSANTQSNRRNAAEMKDVPDLLNPFGNKVCREFLENDPAIAKLLDISLSSESQDGISEDECYFANRLFGRIALLPVGDQERVLYTVTEEFNRQISELESQGANPLKSRELDIKGRVISQELIFGVELPDDEYESVFDKPVYLSVIEYEELRDPMRWDTVQEMITASRETLAKAGVRLQAAIGGAPAKTLTDVYMEDVAGTIDECKIAALPEAFATVEEALADSGPNIVKKLEERKGFVRESLERCYPGNLLQYSTASDGEKRGIVVGITLPSKGQEHHLGKYVVALALPGQTALDRVSFYHLGADTSFSQQSELFGFSGKDTAAAFDAAQKGTIKRRINALTGNLFRAAEMAVQRNLGGAVVYTDQDGRRQRAVFLKAKVSLDDVRETPIDIPHARAAAAYLRFLVGQSAKGEAFVNTGESERTLIGRQDISVTVKLQQDTNMVVISVPGTKEHGGRYFSDKKLIEIAGAEFAGTRNRMTLKADADRLDEIMERVVELGATFRGSPQHRSELNALIFGKEITDAADVRMVA